MTARTPASPARPHPELARAGAVLRALADAMRAAPTSLPPGVPDPEAADARLAEGIPALAGEPLLTWEDLVRNAGAVASALAPTEAGPAAALGVRQLASANGLDRAGLVEAALAGVRDELPLAGLPDLDPDALAAVLDFAARPALRAAAAALAATLAARLAVVPWERGQCPACGAPPTLSVIRGAEHERRLHCARCGTGWAFPRVRCPACGERDHARLGHLHAVGEGEYRRVEVCDSCHGYLKSVALLDAPDADRLLELDLETAALDFLALERGYTRAAAGY